MPLQDLTPQLRTRLSRMERSVGWFIMIATVMLIAGFGYYIYHTAELRGWFKVKAKFYTYAETASGMHVGDPVEMMGYDVGHIIRIDPMEPKWGEKTSNNVYVAFEVFEPNFGYLWTEGTHVEMASSGFLDKRQLNLTKGNGGYAIYITQPFKHGLTVAEAQSLPDLEKWRLGQEVLDGTNMVARPWQAVTNNLLEKISPYLGTNHISLIDAREKTHNITAIWNEDKHRYVAFTGSNIFKLDRQEQPPLNDRLQAMVAQIQAALPGVLQLTNQIAAVVSNTLQLTSNLNTIAMNAKPMVSNFSTISENLRNPVGSLGEWLIPTNINQKLDTTLGSADNTLTNLNTNLVTLNLTLDNLANITSNLNNQVQANTNILTNISDLVVHSDQFVQGLKRFWLFKHLFAAHPARKVSSPTPRQSEPAISPKQRGE